jgi:hypothetical protein
MLDFSQNVIEKAQTLQDLWKINSDINDSFFPSDNLKPIVGGGKENAPDTMFIFINPTKRNIASHKDWQGPRYPWIGTTQIWNVLHKAEILEDSWHEEINKLKTGWSHEFARDLYTNLEEKSFYITNIVKWTGEDATLPEKEKIKLFLPILLKEIEIIKPKRIVTFGQLTFENLTNRKIKLTDYYKQFLETNMLERFPLNLSNFTCEIIPCFFPVGLGFMHQSKAIEILKHLSNNP